MHANGAALRVIRERTGLTISSLARAAGIDRTALTRIESGERRGTPAQLAALAAALAVPITAIAANGDTP
jgi:transcriptional regulator with XRE-family HTH domain